MQLTSFAESAVMTLDIEQGLALLDLIEMILATAETHEEMSLGSEVREVLNQLMEGLLPLRDQERHTSREAR